MRELSEHDMRDVAFPEVSICKMVRFVKEDGISSVLKKNYFT
jgi:hypothetical protein